jgi:hypothetical protein
MGLRKLLRAKLRAQAPQPQLPLSLQLLFPSPIGLGANDLVRRLQQLHPSLAQVRVEVRTGDIGVGIGQMARVQWARHTVLVALLNKPAPPEAVEHAIDAAHYDLALKDQARAHTAHASLVYRGEERAPLEQYQVLGMIAAALIPLGAIVVTNVSAHASYPAQDLLPLPGEDMEEVLRTLPLLALFVGFVKMQVDGVQGLWIRTSGAPLIDLPDLALHVRDHEEGPRTFLMFKHIFNAMLDAKIRFSAGDTVEDETLLWRFRAPRANEGFLSSPRMLVLEPQST